MDSPVADSAAEEPGAADPAADPVLTSLPLRPADALPGDDTGASGAPTDAFLAASRPVGRRRRHVRTRRASAVNLAVSGAGLLGVVGVAVVHAVAAGAAPAPPTHAPGKPRMVQVGDPLAPMGPGGDGHTSGLDPAADGAGRLVPSITGPAVGLPGAVGPAGSGEPAPGVGAEP